MITFDYSTLNYYCLFKDGIGIHISTAFDWFLRYFCNTNNTDYCKLSVAKYPFKGSKQITLTYREICKDADYRIHGKEIKKFIKYNYWYDPIPIFICNKELREVIKDLPNIGDIKLFVKVTPSTINTLL